LGWRVGGGDGGRAAGLARWRRGIVARRWGGALMEVKVGVRPECELAEGFTAGVVAAARGGAAPAGKADPEGGLAAGGGSAAGGPAARVCRRGERRRRAGGALVQAGGAPPAGRRRRSLVRLTLMGDSLQAGGTPPPGRRRVRVRETATGGSLHGGSGRGRRQWTWKRGDPVSEPGEPAAAQQRRAGKRSTWVRPGLGGVQQAGGAAGDGAPGG